MTAARLALACVLTAATAWAAPARPLSEPARWLQTYLRFDTTNPPGGERPAAAYLDAVLRREGVATQILQTPDGRASLYARIGPPGETVLLLHHLDVVAAGDGWSVEPFAGEVRDGRLWGRGAIDDKSLGVAHLAALLDLKRRGTPLRRGVAYLAVADEETGGAAGTGWLVARHPRLFDGVHAVLAEGGTNRVGTGRTLWWGVEVAQKRPLWLEAEASGPPGHASGLRPWSAPHQLVTALARLLARPPVYRVTPAARAYLAALAPLHDERWRRVFARIDEVIAPAGPREPLLPGMASLFLDTVQVTVLQAGGPINVVPARATARIDVRLLPDSDSDAVLAGIGEALGKDVPPRVLLTAPPAAPSSSTGAAYRTIARVLGESGPVVPAMISGFTDARYLREHGIPVYGVAPFALTAEDLRGVHGPDESIPLAELDRGVERMRRLVAALATAP